ncbi:DUF2959 domain-containing protein [Pseudoalteromonas phenolica]|uniref:DUF2959 domain-containing protein n=1 Tax=Pseudoalteromonas phenolica TaxID=161398 RepID=A0A5S3YU76_9GAMM|nr:DUF2959 domain-containing protein [Pseudoalteromonas phenolica]TMP80460.1 DUF2959 domain-containing protein [Pseudoalteromonas phenolica]
MKHLALAAALCLGLTACQTVYYSAMEKVGVHKREILVDRVEATKESQQTSQQEFQTALERLTTLVNFDGGELQTAYEQLNDDYETSLSAANDVSSNIDKVEDVAEALFDEWQDELTQYSNANLKRESEKKLKQTQRQFSKLLKSMRRSEAKMQPVLDSLKDNVLYLKHNLNAQAVSAIRGEFDALKVDIQNLINDMNRSIAESNAFIAQMSTS